MEFFRNLKPTQRLVAIFVALLVGCVLYEALLAYLNSEPLVWEKHFSQGFYYAAIAFAIYHMFTRNKQRKEAEAKKAAAEAEEREVATVEGGEETKA